MKSRDRNPNRDIKPLTPLVIPNHPVVRIKRSVKGRVSDIIKDMMRDIKAGLPTSSVVESVTQSLLHIIKTHKD